MFLSLIPFTIRQQCRINPQEFSTEVSRPYHTKPLWGGRQKKEMGAAHFSLGAHPFPRHITCLNSLGAYSSSV